MKGFLAAFHIGCTYPSSLLKRDTCYANTTALIFIAIKRHKSFSVGERPNISKRAQLGTLKTLPLIPPAESPNNLSPRTITPRKYANLGRRGTIHTLDIAHKEGIMNMKPGTKTTVVDGKITLFCRLLGFLKVNYIYDLQIKKLWVNASYKKTNKTFLHKLQISR